MSLMLLSGQCWECRQEMFQADDEKPGSCLICGRCGLVVQVIETP